MTRTDDAGMADSQVEDLKERVKLINETKPVLAVSIHQNSYPDQAFSEHRFLLYTFKGGEKMPQRSYRKHFRKWNCRKTGK